MMRLVRAIVALGLIWSLYWYAAGYGLRSGVAGWFDDQRARGWLADHARITTSGYPFRHLTMLQSPALADPATGTAWQADWLLLASPAIWPGRQTLEFADTPQRLSYFDRTAVVATSGMRAQLHLHPGLALALERMTLSSGPVSVTGDGQLLVAVSKLDMSMVQTAQSETYDINVDAADFTPGEGIRALAGSSSALPPSFQTLTLDMTVRFDTRWDRGALEQRRPQPVAIDLALARMDWGALSLFATGDLSVDPTGIPTGQIALKAENWREMLAMARAAGAIPEQAVPPTERVLGLLAGLGGNPEALDVQLNFRDGFVALGPLPLGPAPRLILR